MGLNVEGYNMKRFFKIDTIEIKTNEVVVNVQWKDLEKWYLELSLLNEKLVEILSIATNDGKKVLIKRGSVDADRTKNICKQTREQTIEIILPPNQCEYILASMLQAYRDDAADVNHIHLEGFLGKKPYDFNMFFEKAKDALSSDEIEKMIKD